ncbi:TPA: hypothetical protein ACX6PK_003440 [Photobacterium damselae]
MGNEHYSVVVRASTSEDISSGYIWGVGFDNIRHKDIICLRNPLNKRKVWVEYLSGDNNFYKNYNGRNKTINIDPNKKTLILSEYYRAKLGIEKGDDIQIDIGIYDVPAILKSPLAAVNHPDSTVRLAILLGFLSMVLGIISLILSTISK